MKIIKLIFLIIITFANIEKASSSISDSLFMTVGNKPVLQSDIVNEIKILLVLNNESYSVDKRDKLQKLAVTSITKRKIKEIEIERNNYRKYNNEDFNSELIRLSNNVGVDVETLKNICASNDLDFSIIENNIKTDLMWNSLIFQLYKGQLTINAEEIDEQLRINPEDQTIKEYLISEFLIPLVEEDKVNDEIKSIKEKISIDGFENVAKSMSISESSIKGGNLGWLKENIISEKIKMTIINTPAGQLAEPIILPEGILFFKILDKREVKNEITLEERKNKLVNEEKIKILNMHSISHYDKLRRSITIKFIQ